MPRRKQGQSRSIRQPFFEPRTLERVLHSTRQRQHFFEGADGFPVVMISSAPSSFSGTDGGDASESVSPVEAPEEEASES